MPLPGFYNDNAARAYPLIPWSEASVAAPSLPLSSQTSNWNGSNVVITPGVWISIVGSGGRGGGYWQSIPWGEGSVTWTFTIVPGRTYRISATWPASPALATNVPFQVTEVEGQGQGYYPLLESWVNQTIPPSARTDADGVSWMDVGTVTP